MSKQSIVYNPDVLSTLANLSSDEVFTPPSVVNQLLDLLPKELFMNKNTTFLDPASKSGVFLREITKRLLLGLEFEIPDLQERINHILKNQIFGVATTELTALISRRTLYCSRFPNSKFSILRFNDSIGNIYYEGSDHFWINGRCKYCNASESEYRRENYKENYAYDFIHEMQKYSVKNMKFDVIIGNPPYQLSENSGGSSDSANPIYQHFIMQALKLEPRFLSMIIPSKWMVGGRGLDKFRKFFSSLDNIEYFIDYEDAKALFPGVHLDGGVCYFLINKNYKGKVNYSYHSNNGEEFYLQRTISIPNSKFLIRDPRIYIFLEKTQFFLPFTSLVSKVRPFGIRTYLFNEPSRIPEANLSYTEFANSVCVYGVKGIKGGAKRVKGYIDSKAITSSRDSINKYKLFFTTSYSTNAVKPPEIIFAGPNEIATETFLMIGPFETRAQAENCKSYMETNLFRTLLYFGKGTMHVNQDVFRFIPLVDLNKKWDDDLLIKELELTAEHITIIDSILKG